MNLTPANDNAADVSAGLVSALALSVVVFAMRCAFRMLDGELVDVESEIARVLDGERDVVS